MTPEQRTTVHAALKLQGDIKMYLLSLGFGLRADDISCEVMDMVMLSDAVKPEIKTIYEDLANGKINGF